LDKGGGQMKTTEEQQMQYIQKQMDYTALKDASQVCWIPKELQETLEQHAKIAWGVLKKAQTT
jgi:hypothetical protein